MAAKFTRTQEKQYTGWITYPPIGTRIPKTSTVTTKESPWVIATPDGIRAISASELANGFLFKTDKGTEPINNQTAKAKGVNGVIPWTQVVRNTAVVPPVMARHMPGKSNNGLGQFELYPEQFGPQYATRVPGHIFVRMFNLQGGLRNIATPEQAAAITLKPATELVKAKVSATQGSASVLTDLKPKLTAQLQQLVDYINKWSDTHAKATAVKESADGAGTKFIRGDLEVTFPVAMGKKGKLQVPIAILENNPDKVVYNVMIKGETYGVKSTGKLNATLNSLGTSVISVIKNKMSAMSEGAKNTAYDLNQVEAVVKAACDALKDKVAPMSYTVSNGIFEIVTADGSMGTVTCIVKQGVPYSGNFVVRELKDTCPAAKAVTAGLIQPNEKIATLKSLASYIVTGFGRIKRQGVTPVTAPVTENKYEYRLVGRGKSPTTGEVLYVLERIATGVRTTMNRPQLIRLLEEKRVENAWVRWYKNDRQIRLREKGGLATVDVSGLRRSTLNRTEGAQTETAGIYDEVIKQLEKKGFTPEEILEVSEEPPIYGTFSVKSAEGIVIKAMYSPTEWKYGATDGGKVTLRGTVPEDKRRRSILASSLNSLIINAAKNALVTQSASSDAPIVPATDDDFSDPDIYTGEYNEADEELDAVDAFAGLDDINTPDSSVTSAVPEEIDAVDAFAGLEEASVPDSSVVSAVPEAEDAFADLVEATEDPRIEQTAALLESIIISSAAVNTRVENTIHKANVTSADCIEAGNDIMEMKKTFDQSVTELNALVDTKAGPYLPEFDEIVTKATERNTLVETALNKLGAKLKQLQSAEKAQAEAEAETERQAEAERLAAQAEEESQRLAAEAESQRLAEEEEMAEEEEDPFAGLGDDIDTLFRNLPGDLISEGQ